MAYSFSRALTIDHTLCGSADSTDFPFSFRGTYTYLKTTGNGGNVTNANGYDIIFAANADGTGKYDFEMEHWEAATGICSFWIRVPTVSHTANTVVYLVYGNSGVVSDQSNKTGVWTNTAAVYHFPDGTTLTANDSSVNANNLTLFGSPTAVAGQIDGGASFAVQNADYAAQGASTSSLNLQTPFTLSAWVKLNSYSVGNAQRFVNRVASNWNYDYYIDGSTGFQNFAFKNGVFTEFLIDTTAVLVGAWTHVAVVVTGNTAASFYVNGSFSHTSSIGSVSLPAVVSAPILVGGFSSGNNGLLGVMDELKLMSTNRLASWILTEYNNQFDPASFYAVASPTTPTGAVGGRRTLSRIGTRVGSRQAR